MKQNPITKPAKIVVEQFEGWPKAMKRTLEDCVAEALELYKEADKETIAEAGMFRFDKFKNFQFEIDLLKWTEFKHYAIDNFQQDRDIALTIALSCFNEKYTKILSEAF